MLESSSSFIALTILLMLVILVIFALKYSAQIFHAKADASRSNDTELRLSTLDKNARDLNKRVEHLEAMLREVE